MGYENVELLCARLKEIRMGESPYRRGEKLSFAKLVDKIDDIIAKDPMKWEKEDITSKEQSFYEDLEKNKKKPEVIIKYSTMYFEAFDLSEETREKIINMTKIVVLDSSALMNMPHIVKTFGIEFYKIIICDFVMEKLEKYKNNKTNYQNSKKARKAINELNDFPDKVVYCEYEGKEEDIAKRIKEIATEKSKEYTCKAVIISDDKAINAHYLGIDDESIEVISLRDYSSKRQHISAENLDELQKIRSKKDAFDGQISLSIDDINSFFIDGRTLLSDCIINKDLSFENKKKKIKWLIENGADINKNDNASDFFPPLTTAVQKGDYQLVSFLLDECEADPNIGSKYPYSSGTIGIQNEGNTPLMVAAFHGYANIVEKLCAHKEISINQQDRNGYTALIKACMNVNDDCKDILLKYGADKRIRDFNRKTAKLHYEEGLKKLSNDDKIKRVEREIKILESEIEKKKRIVSSLKTTK